MQAAVAVVFGTSSKGKPTVIYRNSNTSKSTTINLERCHVYLRSIVYVSQESTWYCTCNFITFSSVKYMNTIILYTLTAFVSS